MYICYLCNGLERMEQSCPNCNAHMLDGGKLVDYYGDYAPYIESEDAQMIDGLTHSSEEHQCLHVGVCSACNHIEEMIINEQEIR
ncbi:hypothetical protein [Gracilibacillus kekensis]|uniref:Uncharacterized protein n=1 Tax=Gracilibacillus kekensis TaxID=1027249 RepID=A0A1M7J5Q5_9BACI|nr:hypothetical protein [Gracilibacillus kekensis]SHM48334.1 hypothetical protein SAMN05216179_0258 [Gracilibacillus kekensis]